MSIATSSAGLIVKPSVTPISTPSASPIGTPSATASATPSATPTEMSITTSSSSPSATPIVTPIATPSSTTFIAMPTEMLSLPYFTQRSTNSNDSWETVISKNSDSCFDMNTSGQRLKSTKVHSDSNSDLGDSSDIKDLKDSEVSKESINESSYSDDSYHSSNSWETNSSNSFAQRIRQNKRKPKEEVKVMTMVYIWDQNKVVSAMRKRQSDTNLPNLCTFTKTGRSFDHVDDYYECKTCDMAGGGYSICTLCITTCHADHDVKYKRYGRHFCDCGAEGEKSCSSLVKKQTDTKDNNILEKTINQMTIVDFEFKMKLKNNMEENMVARKWQLAEMDATKPEWFNICDMPYNKMWKADEFWKDSFHNGQKFKAYFRYDNQGKILLYEVCPN